MGGSVAKIIDPIGAMSGSPSLMNVLDPGGAFHDDSGSMGAALGIAKGSDQPPDGRSGQISKQVVNEKRRLAIETSDIARKRALMTRGGGGRSLLVKTSPTGLNGATTSTLGG